MGNKQSANNQHPRYNWSDIGNENGIDLFKR